jgi:hypothetical protein
MSKLDYNRKVLKKTDNWKYTVKQQANMPLGNAPVIYNDTMRFGKYKGKRYGEIPTDYLEWLVSVTSDDTQALKYCKELEKRPKYMPKKENFENDESHGFGVYRLQEIFGKTNPK